MQRNDRQIIADYLSGDESAISILIDRHLKTVFNFTHRLVGKSEEVAQKIICFAKNEKNNHLRDYVAQKHNLEKLINKIVGFYK